MDELIRRRMYNIYQGIIDVGTQQPISYEGKIYGSGFVDLPAGSKQYLLRDAFQVVDFNDWAEMVARQLAATNTNIVKPTTEKQNKLFAKIRQNPDDIKSITKLIESLKSLKGSGMKPSKSTRVSNMHNIYCNLKGEMSKLNVHPKKIAETFFDGYTRYGGNIRDLEAMIEYVPYQY